MPPSYSHSHHHPHPHPIPSSPTPAQGARERRRDARLGADAPLHPSISPSKPNHILAKVGTRGARERRRELRRETTPGACDRVMMLLPAKWCAHQVTPSRMKDGMRVVRITLPKAKKPEVSQPKATTTTTTMTTKRNATSPPGETRPLKRVARSPIIETGPESDNSVTSDALSGIPEIPSTPLPNPSLADQPRLWSPSMFEPETEIDRLNWTWSDWDSPSWTFEDVTWRSEDQPRDPFAHLPPVLRERIQAIIAMRPDRAARSDSLTADSVHYEDVDYMDSFSSVDSALVRKIAGLKDLTTDSVSNLDTSALSRPGTRTRDHSVKVPSAPSASGSGASIRSDFSSIGSDIVKGLVKAPSVPPPASTSDTSTHSRRSKRHTRDLSTKVPSDHSASNSDASIHSGFSSLDLGMVKGLIKAPSVSSASASNASIHSRRSERQTRDLSVKVPSVRSASSGASIHSGFSSIDLNTLKSPSGRLGVLQEVDDSGSSGSGFVPGKYDIDSDLESGYTHSNSIGAIMRHIESIPGPSLPKPDDESSSGSDFVPSKIDFDSDLESDYTHSNSIGAIMRHFESIPGPSSPSLSSRPLSPPTFLPQSFTGPVRLPTPPPPSSARQHFHTLRQLPSASAVEPRMSVEVPSQGLGWKSLACVAVGAAAIGAGLAYAWFSG